VINLTSSIHIINTTNSSSNNNSNIISCYYKPSRCEWNLSLTVF